MIVVILRHILRFIVLMLLQVLILNNVQLGTFINPFLYVLFLLGLPIQTPRLLLLALALFTGLSADMFQNTPGMHAAACLLMVYMRPRWLKIISPREGYETDAEPSIRKFGFTWFIAYTSVLVLAHHLLLFYLEVFRFSEFFDTLLRILLSSMVTLLLIILAQYIGGKPKGAQFQQ